MTDGLQILYFIAIGSSVLMILISYLKFLERKVLAFKHLSQFLLLTLISTTMTFLLMIKMPSMIALSCLAWLLPLRGAYCLLEKMIQGQLQTKWTSLILGFATTATLLLAVFLDEPRLATLPMALATTGLGLYFSSKLNYRQHLLVRFGPIHLANFFAFGAYFISRTVLVFALDESFFSSLLWLDNAFLIYFSLALFPMLSEEIFEKHERLLESAVEARNEQLFNHTNLSEFKILSAGVVHEINNALTIINAKVEQMLRINKDPGEEKGLRLILTSANRVNRSVKGLREFIYPQDTWENIEMEELMNRVLVIYGQRLKNHDVDLRVRGFRGKHINGNRIQIEQVFLSLINHAVEELDKIEERWIEITASKKRTNLELVFSDSGPDLSSSLVKILEAASLPIDHDVNEGIRMIQAKKIIEHHGGTLEYGNKSGNQACIILIPLSSQLERTPHLSSRSAAARTSELH
ncbi:MAG TPA: HAMP domain-containing sensor histidine kinase [Bacteriovoracaceae bacterium]|nr:HAMP domain-containing sensor histidine kinase [Bacteriovoracaceae bacterium]